MEEKLFEVVHVLGLDVLLRGLFEKLKLAVTKKVKAFENAVTERWKAFKNALKEKLSAIFARVFKRNGNRR